MTFIEILPHYKNGEEIYRASLPYISYVFEEDLSAECQKDDFIRFHKDNERRFCDRIEYNTGFSGRSGLFADDWLVCKNPRIKTIT